MTQKSFYTSIARTRATASILRICFLYTQTICHHTHKITPDHDPHYGINAAGWEGGPLARWS